MPAWPPPGRAEPGNRLLPPLDFVRVFRCDTRFAFGFVRCYPARVQFGKITILGVGLLGGSLGLAIRQRRLAGEVAGYVRRPATQRECEALGAMDFTTTDLLAAVSRADLVILCTPLAQMRPLTEKFLPALAPGAIVTDVGSVKAGVVRDLESLVARAGGHFIGAHPMAGGEKSGVGASHADLYEGAVNILTPTKKTHRPSLRKLDQFWRALGSRILRMDAAEHDRLVSRSSHLPHVVAASLARVVLDPRLPKTQATLCATGFRDTTRIASGSPEMWRDIVLANRKNLARGVDDLVGELKRFQALLKSGDAEGLQQYYAQGKSLRDDWLSKSGL